MLSINKKILFRTENDEERIENKPFTLNLSRLISIHFLCPAFWFILHCNKYQPAQRALILFQGEGRNFEDARAHEGRSERRPLLPFSCYPRAIYNRIDHNAPCLPPKILHNHCFQFFWVSQRNRRQWLCKIRAGERGVNGVHYGLCETSEQPKN